MPRVTWSEQRHRMRAEVLHMLSGVALIFVGNLLVILLIAAIHGLFSR